jgi:hypothetical protein
VADLDTLKQKRDQLNARIQKAEARMRAGQKKEDDRVKVLVGAALLDQVKREGDGYAELIALMDKFLARPGERTAVLGENGQGSEALRRLSKP